MQKINNSANSGIIQDQAHSGNRKKHDATIKDNSEKFANQITKKKQNKSAKQNDKLQDQIKYSPEQLLSKKHINNQPKGKKNKDSINDLVNQSGKKLANKSFSANDKITSNHGVNGNHKMHFSEKISTNNKITSNHKIDENKHKDLKDKSLDFVNEINTQQSHLANASEAKAVNLNQDIKAHLQNMVDKIHTTVISTNKGISGAEVKIQLKDAILPDTRINIQRVGTELIVSFDTSAEQSKTLLANNESSLQKLLTDKFENTKVQININLSQDHQGRSRNEYIADEQADDETKR